MRAKGQLHRQTLSGVRWVFGVRIIRQGFEFALVAVLARLLTPAEFGLIAMVLVFANLSWLLIEVGFTAALIQRPELRTEHQDTAFWIVTGLSLLIGGALAWCAPLVADLYGQPELTPLTAFLALNLIAGGLGVLPSALLQRRMDFRRVSLIEAGATIAGGLLAVALAWRGFGAWALAWQLVTVPALRSAGFWAVAGWRPALRWRRREAGELLRFGAPLLGSYLLGYSQRNTDNLIIGSVQGAAALGYYSRAYALMLMPLTHITYIMQNVMLASFSRLRRNRRAVRMAYLRAIGVLALITMPMMAGLLATAHAFVLTMFGGQWAAMVPILQLLCVVGLIQPITATSGWLFLSQGRTDLQMRISLLTTPLVVAAFAVGVLWGALGVAAAYAIVNLVIWYPIMAWSGRLVGLEIRGLLRQLRGPLLSSLTMAAAVAWVARWLPADWAAPARLALLVLSGIACYTALAGLLQRRALSDLLELLRPRRRAERTTPSD